MIKGWKKQFSKKILDRGREYAEAGKVIDCYRTVYRINGTVRGHRHYFVEILFSDDTISTMTCTCPYNEDGTSCKHMAAVLYAAEDTPITEAEEQTNADWASVLDAMTEDALRKFCYTLALKDPSVQRLLLQTASVPDKPNRTEAELWRAEMASIINQHLYEDDYQDSYDFFGLSSDIGYDCAEELAEYTNPILDRLLDDKRVSDAAVLLFCLFDAVCTEVDDSDAYDTCRCCVTDYIIDSWNTMLETVDETSKQALFEQLLPQVSIYTAPLVRLHFIRMTLDFDLTEDQFHAYLAYFDENIDQHTQEPYIEQFIIDLRLTLMEGAKLPPEAFVAYLETKTDSDAVFQKLISYVTQYDPERAISMLQKRRESHTSLYDAASDTKQILAILKTNKKTATELYRQELQRLVFDYGNRDTDYLKALKEITESGEWRDLFLQILNQTPFDYQKLELLAFEKMYDVLLLEMEDCQHLNQFLTYQKVLKSYDPIRTLEIYIRLLRQDMENARNRDHYHSTISHLKKLKSFPDGKAAAQELAQYWYSAYPRRTAMQDELKKAGYSNSDYPA